jgi:hypothetical protein
MVRERRPCLPDRLPLERGFARVPGVGPQEQPEQWQAHRADGAHRGDDGEHEGGKGFLGPGVIVFTETPPELRAEKSDEITRHGTVTVILMRAPAAFLLDHLLPGAEQRLDRPPSIRQCCPRTAHGIGGEAAVRQCRKDAASTEYKPPGHQRPQEPEEAQIRPDRDLHEHASQEDSDTIDYR